MSLQVLLSPLSVSPNIYIWIANSFEFYIHIVDKILNRWRALAYQSNSYLSSDCSTGELIFYLAKLGVFLLYFNLAFMPRL